MKKAWKALVGSLVFGVFTIATWAKPVGVFTVVIGKVQIKEEGKWVKAQVGMKVVEKAEIQTGIRAKATIQMVNGNQLELTSGTSVSIDRLISGSYGSATDVNLSLGKITAVIARAPKEEQRNFFRVRTPTAVAGVRGSVQEVSYSPDMGTQVRMIEHSAEAINRGGQKILVPQGGETILSGEKTQTPEQSSQAKDLVVFTNAGVASSEQEFLFFANDVTFSSSAADYTTFFKFWDSLFDEIYNQGFVLIEFEKL